MKVLGHEIIKATDEEKSGMMDYQIMRIRNKVDKHQKRIIYEFVALVILTAAIPILLIPFRLYAVAYAPWILEMRPFTQEIVMGVIFGAGIGGLFISSYKPLNIKLGEKYVGYRFPILIIQSSAIRIIFLITLLLIGCWVFINANIMNAGEAFGFFTALTMMVIICAHPAMADMSTAQEELIRRRRK